MASTFAPKTDSVAYAYLRAAGWEIVGLNPRTERMEWRHPNLTWPWTTATAAQIQRETDDGAQETVHKLLRGEA